GKGEQSSAGRNSLREASFLHNTWPAGGQIAGAAATEPAAVRIDIHVLRDAELAARGLDVLPISVGGGGNFVAMNDLPAQIAPALARSLAIDGHLERSGRMSRNVLDSSEFPLLRAVGAAAIFDRPLEIVPHHHGRP